jgi:PAS domain S-box-containing protein
MEGISKTSREEVKDRGGTPWDIFPHLAEQGIDVLMHEAMEGKVTGRDGIPYRLHDGTSGFTDETYIPLWTSTGEIRGIVGVVHDVTERRRAEEILRESERFLENIFQAIQDGISVLDHDLNVLRVNASMEKMYAPEMPIVGKKCYSVYQKRQSPCPWCPSLKAIKTGTSQSQVVPYPREENPTGWMELSAFPLLNVKGETVGVIEYVRDITDRKLAEERLAEAHRVAATEAHKLRSMIEGMNEGIVVANADDIITEANEWFAGKVGLSRDNLVGKPLWEFHGNTKSTVRLRAALTAFHKGERREPLVVNRELFGMQLSLRVQPIFDEQGYRGIILNVINVTDLVEARLAA